MWRTNQLDKQRCEIIQKLFKSLSKNLSGRDIPQPAGSKTIIPAAFVFAAMVSRIAQARIGSK
jgi:hypothetical protein